MSRLAVQLLIVVLIALVQSAALSGLEAGASDGSGPSQLLEEEELDDDTLTEELVVLTLEPGSSRWAHEQRAPEPVHSEPEAPPPTA